MLFTVLKKYADQFLKIVMCCLLVHLSLSCQLWAVSADDIKQGVVVKDVISPSNKSDAYSIFLPKDYTAKKQWPILYTFSPSGGNGGINRYKQAADELGWIIMASQHSRNGRDNRETIKAMWVDSHALFSVDDKRLYASGMSGGARQALEFVMTRGKDVHFAGLISCGAVKLNHISVSTNSPMHCIMIAGDRDFNYPELVTYQYELDKKKVSHRLMTFRGGHVWAEPPLLAHAMREMELRYLMQENKVNKKTVRKLLSKQMAYLTEQLKDDQLWFEAYVAIKHLDKLSGGMLKDLGKHVKAIESRKTFKAESESFKAFNKIGGVRNDMDGEMKKKAQAYVEFIKKHKDTCGAFHARAILNILPMRCKQIIPHVPKERQDAYRRLAEEIHKMLQGL